MAPYHQGVKCYDRNGKLLHSYDTTNSRLQTNVILSLAERDGQIWVGTDGSGIYILNPKDDTMSVLVRVPGDPYSLPANSILYLYTDSNNNMWAGSVRAGLIHIKEAGMKIYSDALPGFEYALSEKSTLSIYQDEKKTYGLEQMVAESTALILSLRNSTMYSLPGEIKYLPSQG